MCPNCILNKAAGWGYLGPGLLCLAFFLVAALFFLAARESGEFEGDEEEAKHSVFED